MMVAWWQQLLRAKTRLSAARRRCRETESWSSARERRGQIVAETSYDPNLLGRMVLGSHAVRIVHDAAVPALVVPLPPNA